MEYDGKIKSAENAIVKLQNNTQSIVVRPNLCHFSSSGHIDNNMETVALYLTRA